MALNFKINVSLTARERMIVLITLFGLIWFVFDFFFYGPKSREMEEIKRKIVTTENKIAESFIEILNPSGYASEIESMERKIRFCRKNLLRSQSSGKILEQLAGLCERLDIDIMSLRPRTKKLSSMKYHQVFITMDLKCDFKTVVRFMNALRALPVFTLVNALEIRRGKELPEHEFHIVLETFLIPGLIE